MPRIAGCREIQQLIIIPYQYRKSNNNYTIDKSFCFGRLKYNMSKQNNLKLNNWFFFYFSPFEKEICFNV